MSPSAEKLWMNLADFAATTRSQASAMLAPAPAATPLTRAMTGCGMVARRRIERVPARLDRLAEVDRFARRHGAVVEVLPGAKAAPGAGQDDHARLGGGVERLRQFGVHRAREAVEPVGAVERDAGDVVGEGEADGFVGHVVSRVTDRVSWTPRSIALQSVRPRIDVASVRMMRLPSPPPAVIRAMDSGVAAALVAAQQAKTVALAMPLDPDHAGGLVLEAVLGRVGDEFVDDQGDRIGLVRRQLMMVDARLDREPLGHEVAQLADRAFDEAGKVDAVAVADLVKLLVQRFERGDPRLHRGECVAGRGLVGAAGLEPDDGIDRRQAVLDAMIDLAPQELLLAQREAQVELAHDAVGQHAQRLALDLGQRARRGVEHAQRAEREPACRPEQRAGVKAEPAIGGAQRVGAHPRIGQRVGDLDEIIFEDDMAAQAGFQRGRADPEPDLRLEPLAVGVDEVDDRDRDFAHRRDERGDVVELGFPRRVEDVVAAQRGKPLCLPGVGGANISTT